MSLQELRNEIDVIDDQLAALFARRMDVVRRVAEEKAKGGAAIAHPDREREIKNRVASQLPQELAGYSRVLMNTLFDLSRSYQARLNRGSASALSGQIRQAMEQTPQLFPGGGRVACQGIAGAYSQLACDVLLPEGDILYFKSFEGVFNAVEQGLCRYGVLPIENSTHGAVSEVYDLMRRHRFHIVRGVKLQICHELLAKPGTALADVREVFSHEQALGQCSAFLAAHPEITVTVCENTAVAARMVAESARTDVASISSPECARLYGLRCLEENVRNESGNFTRFICIAKDMEIYPGADRISLMLTTEHRPGALHSVIARLAAQGVNISKLQSRPIPGRDFEFMFYFDLDVSIYKGDLLPLLEDLEQSTEQFVFLGAYSEV